MKRYLKLSIILLGIIVFLFACSSESANKEDDSDSNTNVEQSDESKEEAEANEEDDSGTKKVLNVAINAQPASLDHPQDPAVAVRDTARLMFETLVTTDENYKPVPMLAESIDISDDGLT